MKCEKCGSKMKLLEGVVYTSDPPMYGYICQSCRNVQYSRLNEEFTVNSTIMTEEEFFK